MVNSLNSYKILRNVCKKKGSNRFEKQRLSKEKLTTITRGTDFERKLETVNLDQVKVELRTIGFQGKYRTQCINNKVLQNQNWYSWHSISLKSSSF